MGRWPWCRALITLGTPHRGAPKALAWLVNGVRGGAGRVGCCAPGRRSPNFCPATPPPSTWKPAGAATRTSYHIPGSPTRAGCLRPARRDRAARGTTCPASGPEPFLPGWRHATPNASVLGERPAAGDEGTAGLVRAAGLGEGFRRRDCAGVLRAPPGDGQRRAQPDPSSRSRSARFAHRVDSGPDSPDTRPRPARGRSTAPRTAHTRPRSAWTSTRSTRPAARPSPRSSAAGGRRRPGGAAGVGAAAPLDRPGAHRSSLVWDPACREFTGELAGQPPGLYEIRVTARTCPAPGDLDATDVVAVSRGD